MAQVSPYDIVLNGVGLLLARQEQLGRGGRAWSVETVGASIAQRTPTEMRYGNQPAIIEAPMVWRTAHRGYGDREEQGAARYFYAENMDARFPEQVLPGPLVTVLTTGCNANVVAIAEHKSKTYVAGGRYVKSISSSDTVGDERDLGQDKVAVDMAQFDGKLYVSQGAGGYIHCCDTDGQWNTDNDVQAGALCVAHERLYAATGANVVQSVAADPMDPDDWTASYEIGEPGTGITALAALGDQVFVAKPDGLYALDATGIVAHVTPELRAFRHADNGKGLTSWHGVLWMPHVRGLLLCVPQATAYTVASAQPGRDADDTNPVRGWVTAMAGDDRWLYAALYTIAGDTWLLAGREATTEEDAAWGRMVWHPLARLEGKKCEAMHLSSSGTNPRLWFGVGADVGYITLPRYGDNPRHDANCRYATSGRMYYSSACWDVPTTTKVFKSIELVTEHLSPTRYLDVYYRLDGREWVRAGRAIASPQYAISLGTQGVAGKRIEIRLDYASGGTHTPAVVKAIVVRAAERAEQVDVITFVVRCADRLPLNTGGVCPRPGAAILAELKALATMPTAVPLRDVVGLTRQVLVLPPVQEQEVERQAGEPREVLATVRAVAFAVPDTEWVTFQFAISGSSGGMDIPLEIPWAIGTSTLDLHQALPCRAAANVRPVIVVTGPARDMVITNETTGKTLSFEGTLIAAGDSYTIDLASDVRTVVDEAGTDCSGKLAEGSDLYGFYLAPGRNDFHLTGLEIDEATRVTVGYRVS